MCRSVKIAKVSYRLTLNRGLTASTAKAVGCERSFYLYLSSKALLEAIDLHRRISLHIFHDDFSSGVAGEDRVRFSCDFYGGVRDEDHSLWLRRASRSLPPQRLELAGFHDSRDRVSTLTLKLHVLPSPPIYKQI